MKNRPLYHKLYADMIREKYPDKEACCSSYLKKENWTALDVIQINAILFAKHHKQMEIASDQKHRAYDKESVRQILHYQQVNGLNNKQLADKFRLSRNTVAKWRKLFAEETIISVV
ncbi:helix-turn-helix domain-containing protein [Dysgonomonas sp.]